MNYKTGGSKNPNATLSALLETVNVTFSRQATAAEQRWRLPFKGQTEGRSRLSEFSVSVNEVLALYEPEREQSPTEAYLSLSPPTAA